MASLNQFCCRKYYHLDFMSISNPTAIHYNVLWDPTRKMSKILGSDKNNRIFDHKTF